MASKNEENSTGKVLCDGELSNQMQQTSFEFAVEKILSSFVDKDGERYYQVKWVDTWVHEQALQEKCSHVIQAYWELRQKETYDKITNIYQTEEKGSLLNESFEQNQSQLVEEQVCEVELVDDSDNFSARYSNQFSKPEQIIYDNEKINKRLDSNRTCDKTKANRLNPGSLEEVGSIAASDDADYLHNDGESVDNGNLKATCEICEKVLSSKKALRRHITLKHLKNGQHKCDLCDRRFCSIYELQRHMPVHTNVKAHVCLICDKKFKQAGPLSKHMKTHTGEKEFECKICKQRFSQKANLLGHYSVHTSEKHFQCSECKHKFKHRNSVYLHIKKVHSNVKQATCVFSGDKSKILNSGVQYLANLHSQENLQKHAIKEHTANHKIIDPDHKLFSCSTCSLEFNSAKVLKKHLKIHENEIKNLECYYCSRSFKEKDRLITHAKICHVFHAKVKAQRNPKHNHDPITPVLYSKASTKANTEESSKVKDLVNGDEGKQVLSEQQEGVGLANCTASNIADHVEILSKEKHVCKICHQKFLWLCHFKEHEQTHIAVAKNEKINSRVEGKLREDTEEDDKVDFGKVSSYLSSDVETTDQSMSCSSMVANLNEEIQIVRVIANPTSNTVSVIQPGPSKRNPEQNPETPSNGANSSEKGHEVASGEAFSSKEEPERKSKSEKNSRKRKRTVEQNSPSGFRKNEFTCVTCGIHFTKHFELIMHLLQKHKAELEKLKNQQVPIKEKDTQNQEQHMKGDSLT